MTLDALNISIAWPEIFLLSMTCLLLVVDVFLKQSQRNASYLIAQFSLIGSLVLIWMNMSGQRAEAFNGTFVVDPLADILKIFICAVVALVFVYSRDYLKDRNIFKGEFYVLGLFGVLGMMLMVSSNHMLTLYLGLELLSLSMYAMVAFNRESGTSAEAAMKYFILGAIASGMLLYGISIVYGITGSMNITDIASSLIKQTEMNIGLIFGLVFLIVGLSFKLGAVPFHMWVPDVYHGAPTTVTSYIASAPKIAGFAIIIRVLVEAMGSLHNEWQGMLIILAVLSLAVGNIIAIAQTNLKRMLAYSTISHVGFILLGLLAGTKAGYSSAMFYILVYSLMTLGGFGIILLLARAGFESEELSDLKGLNQRSPWFAFMMLIFMFSMAGVPPTVGFWAKLSVLSAVIEIDMLWLALVGVFFSIIGVYYYLRVIKLMYFDEPIETAAIDNTPGMQIALSFNGLIILLLGVYPGALMALCFSVFAV
ncbi:MAG: NADH-quinone oxidoreductase subunit NuoN [Gammaproteobacteria bacterium]|nr:NADH-quinone oxidoreductase subunit NuoN [Gammaproteobacteria bacterium]